MKLKLNVDDLRVDSFETAREPEPDRGTIRGNASCPNGSCFSGVWTCIPEASCGETCGLSCNPTCVVTLGVCCEEG